MRPIGSIDFNLYQVWIINRVSFDLSAQATDSDEGLKHLDMPFVGLALSSQTDANDALDKKVDLIEISAEDKRMLVSGFKEHYEQLLKKQMQKLKQQMPS